MLYEQRKDPATIESHEVISVARYYVTVDALKRPMGMSHRSQTPFAGPQ